jgi:hypothetical protein
LNAVMNFNLRSGNFSGGQNSSAVIIAAAAAASTADTLQIIQLGILRKPHGLP